MSYNDLIRSLVGNLNLTESSVGMNSEPSDVLARRQIESSLELFVWAMADLLVQNERSGKIITVSDLLSALSTYFNSTVAERLATAIINTKTNIKISRM